MRSFGLHPAFGYSHSRHRMLLECPRKFYYQYFGSWRGWQADVNDDSWWVYRLKHLTTLHLALGDVLHECARRIATAIRQGEARPSYSTLLAHCQQALQSFGARDLDAFLRAPKQNPLLLDTFYFGRINDRTWKAVTESLPTLLATLCSSVVWDDLSACSRDGVLLIDKTDAVRFHGVDLYAAPDLVYRTPSGLITLLDWKSGEPGDVREQIALYALYVRAKLGLKWAEGRWQGRFVSLKHQQDVTFTLTREDLIAAFERFEDGVALMRGFLLDTERNIPRDKAAFPLAPHVATPGKPLPCASCPFIGLCHPEIDPDGEGVFHPFEPTVA